jgi:hypothetical protein
MRQCNAACEAFVKLASIALAEGRVEDAARIAGYAQSALTREIIARAPQSRAVEDIAGRIDARMPEGARRQLMDERARLTEPQITALALCIGATEEPKPKPAP